MAEELTVLLLPFGWEPKLISGKKCWEERLKTGKETPWEMAGAASRIKPVYENWLLKKTDNNR